MIHNRFRSLLILAAGLALFGAGCDWKGWLSGFSTTTTRSYISATSTPVEAANAIQFMAGDTFEVRQTVLGFGAFLPDLLNSLDGVRTVTVTRFAPMHAAGLEWSLNTTRETAASKKLRADYEAELQRNPRGIGENVPTPPTVATEKVTATGTVMGLNLAAPHTAFLPTYWPEGRHDVLGEKTGIWLSDDAFQELVRTRHTILNLGLFDESLNEAAKNIGELKTAISNLRQQASEEGARKDLTELEADGEFIEYPIDINGERRMVSAIRAKNWFGEVIILNNRQNPMILKVTLNPVTAGVEAANGGAIDKLFGYEVRNIRINRAQ
ncbi:hypothetical protein IT087_03355 [Candidatus Uhrbacteria bacterium]|nr:hypothetical protein [Candidatus Uhrbacteria bacterium]